MDLSIIIVNWNTRDLLQKCLESVYKFTRNIQFEVIVVDNSSEDGSVEMLEKNFSSTNVIQNDINIGFARAVNKGIAYANGRKILLLNSDSFIKNNAFYKMVAFLRKRSDIVAISCKIYYPDGRIQPALAKYPSLSGVVYDFLKIVNCFPNHKIFNKLNVYTWDYQRSRELEPDLMIGGGCFMIRKSGIDEIGLMDEKFTPAYFEDADWCCRLKEKGLKMYYLAEAEIYHYHGYTCKKSDSKFKEYLTIATQNNRQYFFYKHYGMNKLFFLKCIDFAQNTLFLSYIVFLWCFRIKNRDNDINQRLRLYFKLLVNSFVPIYH